jgi:hypothetical protein
MNAGGANLMPTTYDGKAEKQSLTLDGFRALLESRGCHPSGAGDELSARCPAHEDDKASLSVGRGTDGRLLLHCHAGCEAEAITGALGLTLADLFPARNGKRVEVEAYPYTDEAGKVLFEVVRFEPKDFRQRAPDGKWKVRGIRRVPFHLPQLTAAVEAAKPIFVCEGEKDCLAMERAGFAATTNAGGAGKWLAEYGRYFTGAQVTVIADRDAPGRNHAQDVAAKLRANAASVKVIECPDVNGKTVKDAHDYFAAGGTAADLDARAGAAPAWAPVETLRHTESSGNSFEATTAWVRGEILALLVNEDMPAGTKRHEIARKVVEGLQRCGRFYYHADLLDFDSAMFFDSHAKRLRRLRSDAFAGWLSEWIAVNRADSIFKYAMAEVETAALSGPQTTGILPESFWASRPGALYLSNGDGRIVKITPQGAAVVDNGADQILFSAGRTLPAWKLTEPRDPFKTCEIFRYVHCAAAHGPDLLRLWLYSLPTNPRSKPPLCLAGVFGSGKTRTARAAAELYGLPFVGHKVEEGAESNFWPCLDQGGLLTLDNADSRCKWLADAVAAAATDGCSEQRKLYTNGETVVLRARAWLALTTANPTFANDAGLADRLLLLRMERREAQTSDAALTDEILENRDGSLSHIAATLQKALADPQSTPARLNERHPDFAAFAVKIGRALGRETEAIGALRAAEADKSSFCLENDNVASALIAHLNEAGRFTGTAAELAPKLIALDADLEGRLSAKRLGKRLSALWPHLQKNLALAHKETDRKGFTVFTLGMTEQRPPEKEPETERVYV